MNTKNPIPRKDTVAEEKMHEAELREQEEKHGHGYMHGNIPGPKGDCGCGCFK